MKAQALCRNELAAEMSGSTFSIITNLGMFGISHLTQSSTNQTQLSLVFQQRFKLQLLLMGRVVVRPIYRSMLDN